MLSPTGIGVQISLRVMASSSPATQVNPRSGPENLQLYFRANKKCQGYVETPLGTSRTAPLAPYLRP